MKDLPSKIEFAARRVGVLRRRLQMSLQKTVRSAEYRSLVPKEKRAEAEHVCVASAAEFLSFLSENPSALLAPLHLDQAQTRMIRFLCDACVGDSEQPLTPVESYEAVGNGRAPWIYKSYEAGSMDAPHNLNNEDRLQAQNERRFVSFHHALNVSEMFPIESSVWGFIGDDLPSAIDFSFFPSIPTTADLKKRHGDSDNITVNVYDHGKRYVVKVRYQYQGKDLESMDTYYLLGDYTGDETKKKRFVYGKNEGSTTNKAVEKATSRSQSLKLAPNQARN